MRGPPDKRIFPFVTAIFLISGGPGCGLLNGRQGPASIEHVTYAVDLLVGREIFPVSPLDKEQTRGQQSWRLSWSHGKILRAARLKPSGVVDREMHFEHNTDGTLVINAFDGYGEHTSTITHEPGGTIRQRLHSQEEQINGCHRLRITYSAAGDPVERWCLGPNDAVVVDGDGCELWRSTFNEAHQRLDWRCFTVDGAGEPKPSSDRDGIHQTRLRYAFQGRLMEKSFHDEKGAPVGKIANGCHGTRFTYDAHGTLRSHTCIDAHGAPVAERGTQVASLRYDVDEHGCMRQTTFTDPQGRPAAYGEHAMTVFEMNSQCDILEKELRRSNGKLLAKSSKVAAWHYDYNEQGQRISMSCFDEERRPTSCTGLGGEQGAIRRWRFDEHGREKFLYNFFPDGNSSGEGGGYPHATQFLYGKDGRLVAKKFYDAQGRPAEALGGVSTTVWQHNEQGKTASARSFDQNGEATINSTNCHEIRFSYNAQGRIDQINCFGIQGEGRGITDLILDDIHWPFGASRVKVRRGAQAANEFFDPQGTSLKIVDCRQPEVACYR